MSNSNNSNNSNEIKKEVVLYGSYFDIDRYNCENENEEVINDEIYTEFELICDEMLDSYKEPKSTSTFTSSIFLNEQLKKTSITDPINPITTNKPKQNLILDLDETLIHTLITSNIDELNKYTNKDNVIVHFVISRNFSSNETSETSKEHYITMARPYLYEFLSEMYELYNLYIYTNGTEHYAMVIINVIIQQLNFNPFVGIYTRNDKSYHKFISRINGISNKNTIIIDDSPIVWVEDFNNQIIIKPYMIMKTVYDELNKENLTSDKYDIPDNDCELKILSIILQRTKKLYDRDYSLDKCLEYIKNIYYDDSDTNITYDL